MKNWLTIAFCVLVVQCENTEFSSEAPQYETGDDRAGGEDGKEKLLRNSAFSDQTDTDAARRDRADASADRYDSSLESRDTSNPSAPASTIDVLRLCSDRYSQRAQTTLKNASMGVMAALYPINGHRDAKSLVFDDPVSTSNIRRDIMNFGRFALPLGNLQEGRYRLILCDMAFRSSCDRVSDSSGVRGFFGGQPGQIANSIISVRGGQIDGLESTTIGRGARNKVQVLTDINLQRQAMFNTFSSFFQAAATGNGGGMVPLPNVAYNGVPGVENCDESASPLIIDMGHAGIDLDAPFPGVAFDIDGDGREDRISWPSSAMSAFLVLDRNKNGLIDDGRELFGNNSPGPDGKTAANGFLALAKYDDDEDGQIDISDAIYLDLRLWTDANKDGRTDIGELSSLSERKIVAIDLDYADGDEKDAFGNSTRQRSVVHRVDGTLNVIVDIWFRKL